MASAEQPWQRRADESPQAYAAFCAYYLLSPGERSIDLAWKRASKEDQRSNEKRASGRWRKWASDYAWVERAAHYDGYLADQDRLKWEERRRQLQESDWQDGLSVRKLVMDSLPEASRFIERKEVFIKGKDGAPDTLVITESFNITALARTLSEADKLQRLATDEPTENVNLSGAALDAAIARELAKLADRSQAPTPSPSANDKSGANPSSNDGDGAV